MSTTELPAGYIPRDKRKKILLLSDDLRMPSGVGVMSKEIVVKTAHRYNWAQLGAGINHPEAGRVMDGSESLSKELGIPDAYMRIYPNNGYGDGNVLRKLLMTEKPDAILHFTDPRYWIWLYHMEAEVREHIPIMFYHVWDDLPFPKYNEGYYRSCDSIACISRQTYNIVNNVWKKEPLPEPWQIQYVPHGVDPTVFKRLDSDEDKVKIQEFRKKMFGDDADTIKFTVLYNNRNIRRKMTSDVILAYRKFLLELPEKQREECRLILHTAPVDDNGTDLYAVLRDVAPEVKYIFSTARISPPDLNVLYNNMDVVINLASNEGFGLSTLEGILAERLIIANVTGGLQDQMGFRDEDGEYLHEDKHYGADWGSNSDGKYRTHGEWVLPVFPNNRALVGSPPTPYIFDDRCDWQEAADQIRKAYDMTSEERERRGKLGREYALTQGYNTAAMVNTFCNFFDTTFANWKPRKLFDIWKI